MRKVTMSDANVVLDMAEVVNMVVTCAGNGGELEICLKKKGWSQDF